MYLHETRLSDRLTLEGELSGPWVGELALCCDTLLAGSSGRSLLLDVSHLSGTDDYGQQLLDRMHAQGVTITGQPEASGEEPQAVTAPRLTLWQRWRAYFFSPRANASAHSESILPARLVL